MSILIAQPPATVFYRPGYDLPYGCLPHDQKNTSKKVAMESKAITCVRLDAFTRIGKEIPGV